MGLNPSTESNIKQLMESNKQYANAMHANKAAIESREPKDLNGYSTNGSDQLNNSGHGVCEYMGATHSSQHTAPDAEHSSTCCCPTHEMWELPTPLIVANRSQQGDEVCGSYPLVLKTIILLEADARIQGSTRKRHVLVTVMHLGTSSKSSLCTCWFIDVSTGFDDVGATSSFLVEPVEKCGVQLNATSV
ncbi:hypothetical protein F511_33275 [Dorcoceras hygrometricum]|uniref:Uncharacterized protein n=1 Tax=Dorcoceras hygrometricum TaxID=472368 RepID=A0A2Z7CG24_9LAMI|nr:hypothetical protein F511_33275 [Dorcoceras hygrometricum]